jgi:hypothetical protein
LALHPLCFEACLLKRQFDLSLLRTGIERARGDRVQRGFHTERLQQPNDLASDGLIDPQRAKRDARVRPVIDHGAATMVTAGVAVGAAVGDMQLAPAMAAAQEPGENELTFAQGATRIHAHTSGVVGDQVLVPLELRPR